MFRGIDSFFQHICEDYVRIFIDSFSGMKPYPLPFFGRDEYLGPRTSGIPNQENPPMRCPSTKIQVVTAKFDVPGAGQVPEIDKSFVPRTHHQFQRDCLLEPAVDEISCSSSSSCGQPPLRRKKVHGPKQHPAPFAEVIPDMLRIFGPR